MTTDRVLAEVAELALPGLDHGGCAVVRGQFHDVVLWPGRAAVKVARGAAVDHLVRRAGLLRQLSKMGLPFAVPAPLGDVVRAHGRSAVALSWVDGQNCPRGTGDPQRLRNLLAALAEVPLDPLRNLLDRPHAYAGRDAWPALMLEDAVPRLPRHVRAEATRRVHAALELPSVTPSLVHGDLASTNVRWNS